MAFIEGCPPVRGGLYEGLHCIEGCPHIRGGLYEEFHCKYTSTVRKM